MVYALNVYDIVPGKEALYAEYAEKATPHIAELNVEIVAAGHNPVREVQGQTRNHFVVARFDRVETFDALIEALAADDLHRLREAATDNYIWTIYEDWAFGGAE